MNQDLPNPPVQTEEDTQQTTQQIQESLDYRDLLSSQIMAEQAKANASKYVMGGLQASGVAQTGVAQSVLSGIQAGYQNTLAQNMNQFAMTQDIRQAEQLSQTQAGAINTATTLLSEPDLTQSEYEYIYNTYYNQMSPQDQQTFKFLYDRKGRELGFLDETGAATTTQNIDRFFSQSPFVFREKTVSSGTIYDKYENFQSTLGKDTDEQTIKDLYTNDITIYNAIEKADLTTLSGKSAQEISDMFIRMGSAATGSRANARGFADAIIEKMLFGGESSGGKKWVIYDSLSGNFKIKKEGLNATILQKLTSMGFKTGWADSSVLVLNKGEFDGDVSYTGGKGMNDGGELVAQIYAKFLYTLAQQ